jgi:hypothetical protein
MNRETAVTDCVSGSILSRPGGDGRALAYIWISRARGRGIQTAWRLNSARVRIYFDKYKESSAHESVLWNPR